MKMRISDGELYREILIGKTVGERGYVLRERNCPDVGGCRAQTVLLHAIQSREASQRHGNRFYPVEPQQTEI